jgi:hypothetical protein
VRDVRLSGEPGALVLSGPGGRTTRFPVGPGGVVEALHVGGRELRETAPGSLGAVDLHDADGALRHRLDLRLWVPEADELSDADEALRRSG